MATHRLSSADFKKIRPQKRIHGSCFTLSVSAHPVGLKWACVVSKKAAPKAVTRNLIRRRCRAAAAPFLKKQTEPLALVFQAKREAAAATFTQIRDDVQGLLSRAGLHGTMRRT